MHKSNAKCRHVSGSLEHLQLNQDDENDRNHNPHNEMLIEPGSIGKMGSNGLLEFSIAIRPTAPPPIGKRERQHSTHHGDECDTEPVILVVLPRGREKEESLLEQSQPDSDDNDQPPCFRHSGTMPSVSGSSQPGA